MTRPRGVRHLLKDRVGNLAEFIDAIRRVGRGGSVVDPEVVATLLGRPPGPLDELTAREHIIRELMAEARLNLAIAARLGLTEKTIEGNVRIILSKLGLEPAAEDHRRVLAVLALLLVPRQGHERSGVGGACIERALFVAERILA